MIFTLLAILFGLVFLWRQWIYSFWKRQNVPSPEPLFPVGNLGSILAMKLHMGVAFQTWYKQFKDYPWIGYYKTTTPSILVRDLDLIKDILIKDFSSFPDNDVDFNNEEIISKNPFALSGDDWKASRAVLSPLFTLNRCKQLFPLMQPAVNRLKEYLIKNGPDFVYDAKKLSSQFTTENVVKCGYSMDAGCFEDPKCEFREMGKKIFQPSFLVGMKFLIQLFVPVISRTFKFKFMAPEISVWLKNILENNLQQRTETPLPQEDLFQWLLNGMEKEKLDKNEVISHAFSFFIEGFETSSGVMACALYSLAKNPDIQQRLREEVLQTLDRHGQEVTFDALQDMGYLERVVLETMRLYPPGMMMSKRCAKPYEMPRLPGQKSPFVCQPGTTIMIPVYAIHMNEEIYPDPEAFNPDRFTEEERRNRHKAAYLPAGEGPRMCLGIKFAYTQIKLAIAHLIADHEIILESPKGRLEVDPAALMFQSKENLMIRFKAIEKM